MLSCCLLYAQGEIQFDDLDAALQDLDSVHNEISKAIDGDADDDFDPRGGSVSRFCSPSPEDFLCHGLLITSALNAIFHSTLWQCLPCTISLVSHVAAAPAVTAAPVAPVTPKPTPVPAPTPVATPAAPVSAPASQSGATDLSRLADYLYDVCHQCIVQSAVAFH